MVKDKPRISRLLAIITQLQTKKVVSATELASRYNVSTRTIYRDIRTLEGSGIPIYTEEGKGFGITAGFFFPPLMLSNEEMNALITSLHLVENSKDTSLIKMYKNALGKLKSLLKHTSRKDNLEFLSKRTHFDKEELSNQKTNLVSELQNIIINFKLCEITYVSLSDEKTVRRVESFAIFCSQNNWILIAFCRLRNDFRNFRLDCIEQIKFLNESFEPHNMTLQEYYDQYGKK